MIYLVIYLILLLDYYELLSTKVSQDSTVDLEKHLQNLQTSFIWNIYKQVSNEMLKGAAELPYYEVEKNLKELVLEPLSDVILKKTVN